MPNAVAIAIIDESFIELHPTIVAAQEIETCHCLEPEQRERYIRLDCISVGQDVTHDEMRLRHHFLPEELKCFLARERLRDPIVDALDTAEVFVPEDRHVREHRQGINRWRRRFRSKHVSVANAHPGLFAERGVEVRHGALENAARRATQSWI